jgi:hypothetical protein
MMKALAIVVLAAVAGTAGRVRGLEQRADGCEPDRRAFVLSRYTRR